MKFVVIFVAFLFAADVSLAFPANDANYRWELTPNSAGKMHLVDLKPVDEPLEPLFNPESDVHFLVFTRQNPTAGQRIFLNNAASVQSSNFNPGHPTRITIHGWQGSSQDAVNIQVNAAYLQHGQFNLITVDWTVGASSINYITSRNRVSSVGLQTARLIDFLHANGFVRFPDLHVIGHSLGGHAVGHAGKAVTRGRIQVVYALDPAGPLFSVGNPNERVASTDGIYVEVMHTNGGVQGIMDPIGHADFYPNFGRSQPGCGIDVYGACAHARTVLLYAESINRVFTGRECTSFSDISSGRCTQTARTARMGGPNGNIGLRGLFHLTTNSASPFSQG